MKQNEPIDLVKRAQQIRGAIDKKKIKHNDLVDEILALIDEIISQEQPETKSA